MNFRGSCAAIPKPLPSYTSNIIHGETNSSPYPMNSCLFPMGRGWKAFSFSVTVPYATYAHIVLENPGGGEVIFDDLRIEMTENPRETASGWQGSWISCGGEEAQHTGFPLSLVSQNFRRFGRCGAGAFAIYGR